MADRLRLAEILGALSLATDMATACPLESGINATILSTRIGERAGLPAHELPTIFYATLTRMLGCTASATETAALANGDDRRVNRALLASDWAFPDAVTASLDHNLDDVPDDERTVTIRAATTNLEQIAAGAPLHCSQAMMLTGRLPLPPGVPDAIASMWSRWDGLYPGAAGEDIPLIGRIIPLARAAELARAAGGPGAALTVVETRAGTELDPALCELFAGCADELFDGFHEPSTWDLFLDIEPGVQAEVNRDQILTVAETFSDFVDQKSGWFAGHSRRVSALAADTIAALGASEDEQRSLRLAGLLHDVGRAAVPNGIWDKPGPLTPRERQLAESHAHHTESVLKLSSVLTDFAGPAATAHERADGTGYHHGRRAVDPATAALGISDVYDALSHERPWRPAFDDADVVNEIQAMCAAGSLHAECAAALLTAARDGETIEARYPAGLTPREVDVIRLMITGMPTKTIAARLSISAKTADKHIQSVYEKTGARGRAPVALYALEHGLMAR